MPSYVYVMLNPGLPGLVKIGRSDRHPHERARELNGTGSPYPFVAAYWREVADGVQAEAYLHNVFSEARVNNNREFFQIEVLEVIHEIQKIPAPQSPDGPKSLPEAKMELYWVKIQESGPFVRMGVTDLPKSVLRRVIQETMKIDYPNTDIEISEPVRWALNGQSMGDEVLSHFKERRVKSMPGVYSSVSVSDLNSVYEGYADRLDAAARRAHAIEATQQHSQKLESLRKRI